MAAAAGSASSSRLRWYMILVAGLVIGGVVALVRSNASVVTTRQPVATQQAPVQGEEVQHAGGGSGTASPAEAGAPWVPRSDAEGDRLGLEALYEHTMGKWWVHNAGWGTELPIGEWEGVQLNSEGRLVRLQLAGNNISGTLPEEVGNWDALESATFADNLIIELPESVGRWGTSLARLTLSNNLLSDLPPTVFAWQSLKELDLASNLFSSLPAVVEGWTRLSSLTLSNNALTSLPDAVHEWGKLKEIHLKGNKLESLPHGVSGWSAVTEVIISHNQLQELPDAIGDWGHAETVDFSHNALTALPAAVARWSAIQSLFLNHNSFRSLGSEAAWATVRHLNLNSNHFATIPAASAKGWVRLSGLFMSNNELTTLSESLQHAEHLTMLWLDANPLQDPPPVLKTLRRLRVLSLKYTQIGHRLPHWKALLQPRCKVLV